MPWTFQTRLYLIEHLRKIPKLQSEVRKQNLEDASKERLFHLAALAGLDIDALQDGIVQEKGGKPLQYVEAEVRDMMREAYPFKDDLEFDLTLRLLGKTVKRRAKVQFQYRPDWNYWDPQTAQEREGWFSSTMELFIQSVPDKYDPPGEPEWIRVDLFADGILPSRVWDKLDEEIDLKCQTIDKERRKQAEEARAKAQTSKKLN